jgi:hypothetical protein
MQITDSFIEEDRILKIRFQKAGKEADGAPGADYHKRK